MCAASLWLHCCFCLRCGGAALAKCLTCESANGSLFVCMYFLCVLVAVYEVTVPAVSIVAHVALVLQLSFKR